MTEEGRAEPYYHPIGSEVEVFSSAWRRKIPILLKGPTGCGKTRFVEAMAHRLDVPIYTVACHEDLMAADLLGRYVLKGEETVWIDGPLTRAVREGGICYLDEIVEAHQDTTVVLHPLADHRRELHLDRLGGVMERAAEGFCLVVSYNPGYQSVLKDLKVSTRQRMAAIELDFPPPDAERAIVARESGVDERTADLLVRFGAAIRRLDRIGLQEVASTRTLVTAAHLVDDGLELREAILSGIVRPLTDDPDLSQGLITMLDEYLAGAPATNAQ